MRAPLLGLAKSIYYFITRTSSAANSMYILYTHQWWYLWLKRIKKKKRNHSERELFKKSIGWLAVLIPTIGYHLALALVDLKGPP